VRILVFGAGAMGSLIGALLSQRHEVTLVGRRAHVEAVRGGGLRVRGRTELHVWPHAVERAADADPPELAIVTVKSYDTGAAAR
jgi:2-dehydropantoate 2-reductase